MKPVALSIAGSDSSGGAGLQADLAAFAAFGVHGATAITAVTAQNRAGVRAMQVLPTVLVRDQIDAVFEEEAVEAVKLGMLAEAAVIEVVAASLRQHRARAVVIDPVMIASSGARLLREEAVVALRCELLPLADCLTPNLDEAAALLEVPRAADEAQMLEQGRALLALGARAVLMKGGHVPGETVVDVLLTADGETTFEGERLDTRHTHGTGCTLASACATGLALGLPLAEAVAEAWAYVHEAMRQAPGLGAGHGPLAHNWPLRGAR